MRPGAALALLAIVAIPGCTRGCAPKTPASSESQSETICHVGPCEFSRADLELRRVHAALMYPQSSMAELGALSQLIKGALTLQVLQSVGAPITEAQLNAEVERIFANTGDAFALDEIARRAGGRDHPTFRRIVVLPDYANHRYHFEVFPALDEIQRPVRERAQMALNSILKKTPPVDLYAAALQSKCEFQRLGFSVRRGLFREDSIEPSRPTATPMEEQPMAREIEDEIFAQLKEDEIHSQLLDLPGAYCIIRWVGWHDAAKDERCVERLIFTKVQAWDYFWEQAQKVRVRVLDEQLKASLRQKVDWANRLNWQ